MRTVDLGAATGVRFTDAELQREFKEYFEALAAARSKEKRSVYVDSTDAKQRDVQASYMIPIAGVEIELPADSDGERASRCSKAGRSSITPPARIGTRCSSRWFRGGRFRLSASCIRRSMCSGRKRICRTIAAAAPVLHAGGVRGHWREAEAAAAAAGAAGRGRAAMAAAARRLMSALERLIRARRRPRRCRNRWVPRVPSPRTPPAGELGELFEYRMSQPVTIRKDESAMLPFLQQEIDARKLLIYSHTGSEHPTNAAELTNSTGKTLDGGPITVYDGGAYGGEALMETLKQGDKRLISYAVDLGTRVTEAFDSKADVIQEIHVNTAFSSTKMAAEETRTYTVAQCGSQSEDAHHRASAAPGIYAAQPEADGEDSDAYSASRSPSPADATQTVSGLRRSASIRRPFQVSNLTPDLLVSLRP